MPFLTNDAWDRMSKAVRDSETARQSFRHEPDPIPPPYIGVVVQVTNGTPVVVTTTTPSYTSSTTSTSSTSSSTSSTSTSTTQPTTKYLYEAKFVYRNIDSLSNVEWWHLGEVCWIQEVHNETLAVGDRFPGQVTAAYQGLAVVAVRKSSGGESGSTELCRITGPGTIVEDGQRLLPAVVIEVENESDVLNWVDEIEVWVIQSENYFLSNGFICHAKKSDAGDYDLDSDIRSIYITSDREPTVKLCRVGAAAIGSGTTPTIRYYPCKFNTLDVPIDEWLPPGTPYGPPYDCFLVQRFDYDLTVSGLIFDGNSGCYTGVLQAETKELSIPDDATRTLPVYVTTDAPFLSPDCKVRN